MESVRDGRVPASAWPSPDDAAAGLALDRAYGSASPAFPDVVRERLNSVLDADVIPRLLLAHSHDAASQPAANPLVPPVDNFMALVVHGDAALAADAVLQWLAEYHQLDLEELRASAYIHEEHDAVRHMMRVASGLDSLVLGEPQILGQMKSA